MQNIESTIQELGKIFSQMAEMIQMQGEKIERIDANIEDVVRVFVFQERERVCV